MSPSKICGESVIWFKRQFSHKHARTGAEVGN
jgi:hypothetical protein